jgi:WS/DGAT/MGAT family acyltransferase
VFFLEGDVDDEALLAWHRRAADALPRMAARITPAPFPGGRPHWRPVPNFDPARHIRRVRAPGTGTPAEVLTLVERFGETPFVPSRPPWECLVVEGLENDQCAYVLKISHTVADGLRLRELFLRQSDAAPMLKTAADAAPTAVPLPRGRATRSAARRAKLALRFGVRLLHDVRNPPRIPAGTGDGQERRYFTVDLPLAQLRETARRGGGTTQDALVAGLAEGCRRYNAHCGVERMRATVFAPYGRAPLKRHADSLAGNHWFIIRFEVPCGPQRPRDRIAASRAAVTGAYHRDALDWMGGVARVAPLIPARWLQWSFRHFIASHDLILSNIPGPRSSLQLAGATVDRLYGIAPTLGAAITATTVSYRDACHVVLNIDPAVVRDPLVLQRCMRDGLQAVTSGA